MLDLYTMRRGKYLKDEHRIMVFADQYLYRWHVDRLVFPNEKLTPEQRKPVGFFSFRNGRWLFVNQTLDALKDLETGEHIPREKFVVLKDTQRLQLSDGEGGKLARVQIVTI
jgi:hypothetical protein